MRSWRWGLQNKDKKPDSVGRRQLAVGSRQSAVGSRQLAVGSWQPSFAKPACRKTGLLRINRQLSDEDFFDVFETFRCFYLFPENFIDRFSNGNRGLQ